MSTPVESDKRDRGRVGLHNESSSMEVACRRDGETKDCGMNSTIPVENTEREKATRVNWITQNGVYNEFFCTVCKGQGMKEIQLVRSQVTVNV